MQGQGTFKEKGYKMPKWGNHKIWKEVTADKPLGYGDDTDFPESTRLDQLIRNDPQQDLLAQLC